MSTENKGGTILMPDHEENAHLRSQLSRAVGLLSEAREDVYALEREYDPPGTLHDLTGKIDAFLADPTLPREPTKETP
jgi:hypothetical protein